MRALTALIAIACSTVALVPHAARAQGPYGDRAVSPSSTLITPLAIDEPRRDGPQRNEPRRFPAPESALPAAPLGDAKGAFIPAYPQANPIAEPPAARRAPPFDIRLVTAEEPVRSAPAAPARRLSPRREAAQKSLSRPVAISPGKTLGTVAGSLAVVLGLFVVIAWTVKKGAPQANMALPKEAVEVLGRAVLGIRQQVQLVRVGNKLLLVACTPTSAKTLTEITAPAEVEHLLGLCRRGQSSSASVAFLQTLSELNDEPAEPGFLGGERSQPRGAR